MRWNVVEPVPLTALVPGAVVWAHVPYADGTGWKTRPVVVLDRRGRELRVVPLSSSANARCRWDGRPLSAWPSAGLHRDCVPTGRVLVLDRIDVIDLVGHLAEDDRWVLDLCAE